MLIHSAIAKLTAIGAVAGALLAGCGGSDDAGSVEPDGSRAVQLVARMPTHLDGEPLEVMPMTGEVWLKAAPSAYALGLKADVKKWLAALGRGAQDMSVAWSRSTLVWVVGYSIRDVPAGRLLETFLASGSPHVEPRVRRETIGGKRVVVIRVLGSNADYLLVRHGFLFHLPYIPEDVAAELIAKL